MKKARKKTKVILTIDELKTSLPTIEEELSKA